MPILWGSELEYWSCCMWYELGSLHLEVIVAGGDRASHNNSPAISLRMWCHQVSAWLISSICLSTQYRLYLKRILVFLLIMAGYIESRQGIHEVNYFSNPQSSHFSMKKNILPDFREENSFKLWVLRIGTLEFPFGLVSQRNWLRWRKPKEKGSLKLRRNGGLRGKNVLCALSFQTLSYNRHNLTADTSERQAKEILIRRRHSLRESLRKDSSLNRERRASVAFRSLKIPRTESSAVPLTSWQEGTLALLVEWLLRANSQMPEAGINNKVFFTMHRVELL